MTAVTPEQVRAFRVARHRLDARAPAGSGIEIAAALVGVHAQLASSAELALWARVEELGRDEVRETLEERKSLVKTWAMRGTLHLLPTADLPVVTAVLGPRWDSPGGAWLRGHGVTEEHYEAIMEAVPAALEGRALTRDELADEVARRAGNEELRKVLLSGWGAQLKPLAHRGQLCFGPMRGRNVTFVRPEDWLGRLPAVSEEEGGRELVRRYLAAYGPASHDDIARWLGTRAAHGKRLLAALGDESADVELAGARVRSLAADVDALASAAPARSVRLLPAFDPYVIGFRPREHLVAQSHEARIFRPQGWISPVLLVDGAAAGVWKHERRRSAVEVRVEPFAKLAAVRRALEDEGDRLGAFLGAPVRLSFA